MPPVPVVPLKPWFQTLDDLGGTIDWSAIFPVQRAVELDIGCGRGLFVFTAASATPDRNFAGIEIDYREGRRAAMRLVRRRMDNARIIGGDCRLMLTELIAPGSVAAAHVYFPDPWWKRRHHKRRLFNPEFVQLLARIVQPGGHVHHWTDVADYFEMASALLDADPNFVRCPTPPERTAASDMDYQTSFERKKRKLGLPIWRGLWQRT